MQITPNYYRLRRVNFRFEMLNLKTHQRKRATAAPTATQTGQQRRIERMRRVAKACGHRTRAARTGLQKIGTLNPKKG